MKAARGGRDETGVGGNNKSEKLSKQGSSEIQKKTVFSAMLGFNAEKRKERCGKFMMDILNLKKRNLYIKKEVKG